MVMGTRTLIIANPAAAGGRVGGAWDRICSGLKESYGTGFDVEMTRRRGHATELARQALRAGYEMVVALGGDGTINEVMNGFFEGRSPLNPDAVLGLLPIGTGNDLAMGLGIPRDLNLAAQTLSRGRTRRLDVGKASVTRPADGSEVRYFLNVADFGAGGAVADRVNRTTKVLGAQAAFLWGVLATMVLYKNPTVAFSVDGDEESEAVLNDVIVANGSYFGGGLKPAPHAQMDDGLFDIVTLGDIGFMESVWNLPRLRRGTHLTHPKVKLSRGKTVLARSRNEVLVEADGELIGSLPASFEVIPQAIRVRCPNPE